MFKWLVKKQLEKFARRWNYDTGYVREIIDEAGVGAVMPLQGLGWGVIVRFRWTRTTAPR
jgi:predicted RNase H-like nuclease (RuvC/YqgF family)